MAIFHSLSCSASVEQRAKLNQAASEGLTQRSSDKQGDYPSHTTSGKAVRYVVAVSCGGLFSQAQRVRQPDVPVGLLVSLTTEGGAQKAAAAIVRAPLQPVCFSLLSHSGSCFHHSTRRLCITPRGRQDKAHTDTAMYYIFVCALACLPHCWNRSPQRSNCSCSVCDLFCGLLCHSWR